MSDILYGANRGAGATWLRRQKPRDFIGVEPPGTTPRRGIGEIHDFLQRVFDALSAEHYPSGKDADNANVTAACHNTPRVARGVFSIDFSPISNTYSPSDGTYVPHSYLQHTDGTFTRKPAFTVARIGAGNVQITLPGGYAFPSLNYFGFGLDRGYTWVDPSNALTHIVKVATVLTPLPASTSVFTLQRYERNSTALTAATTVTGVDGPMMIAIFGA